MQYLDDDLSIFLYISSRHLITSTCSMQSRVTFANSQ